MSVIPPRFERPIEEGEPPVVDPNLKIWRYLDLMKLLSLLDMGALYFARSDFLGDPHEGALGKPNLNKLRQEIKSAPNDEKKRIMDQFNQQRRHRLTSWAVSCWHMNERESMAMWEQYATRGAGFAIQSTAQRLIDALQGCGRETFLSKINYCDYDTQEVNEDVPIFALSGKRLSFEHERELRVYTPLNQQEMSRVSAGIVMRRQGWSLVARPDGESDDFEWFGSLYRQQNQPEEGVYVPVNVDRLIERVYVGPTIPSFGPILLRRIFERYHLEKQILQSDLDRPPFDHLWAE
jgi:hypothetical protein